MKTKLKLRNAGVRNHPYWHIIVQADKKNLKGRYIEKVGMWMPRKTKTVKRGIVLNKHKIRYWLSVGAQPTNGVIRLLNKFDFYPKSPIPFGADSVYEKPEKVYKLEGWKDNFKNLKNPDMKYKQMLQEQINVVERQRRIQAEAMASLGAEKDIELVKTDDIESEEADIFQRVEKFQELNKRFEKHRKEQWKLKGNDLRYNIYLKKMQKLTRMDLGLDLEGYKDYVNNLKEFAKYNKEWEILAEDNAAPHYGTMNSPYSEHSQAQLAKSGMPVNQEEIDQMRSEAQNAAKTKQLKNTVLKLMRDNYNRLLQKDLDIVEEFEKDPRSFLDNSADLTIEIKKMYDKRIQQVKERNQMNTYHIEQVTDKDLERCGVSKREFELIKKLMKLDNQIFAVKEFKLSSPYTYIVDLSKYDSKKIPQDCKEVLFRPKKMRTLYERYWAIASEFDKKDADEKLAHNRLRWNSYRHLKKGDDEFLLMDKIVEIIDRVVEENNKELNSIKYDKNKIISQAEQEAKKIAKNPPKRFFVSGFHKHAEQIVQQVKDKGFATKSQLEYLALFNEIEDIERPYHFSKQDIENTVFISDMQPSQQLRKQHKIPQLNTSTLPQELKEKFDKLNDTSLTFKEKSDLLSWFVDSMRVQVLDHLEDSLQNMDERGKSDLIDELDDLHKKCQDQLFQLHNTNAKGTLVMQNEHLDGLLKEINEFKDRIDVVSLERNRLDMIIYHNNLVDQFCKKFDESEAKLDQYLPQLKEKKKQAPDALEESFKHLEVMDEGEAYEIIEQINKKYEHNVETYQNDIENLYDELMEKEYTAARHGLNYAKLYHGLDGGYSMEKLKKVLQRIKNDVKDNLHPFIDPREDNRVDEKLKKILKLRMDEKVTDEAAQEDAADDEEGEKIKTGEEYLLESIEDEEEREYTKELLNLVNERRAKEIAEDLESGAITDEQIKLNDADLHEIEQLFIQEHGLHLDDIDPENEEEYTAAWVEWVKTKIQVRRKKRTVTYLDKKVAELKQKRPELSDLLDELQGQDYSTSLVGGEWIPDTKNYFKEMDRVEANIGRYPVGFRYYENYQNYNMKYPEATIQEYVSDLNSQITFDEFFQLSKKAFLYECHYNPELISQFALDELDSDDEDDREARPEAVVETQEFYDDVEQTYTKNVHASLLKKEWFKKVDAFEMFTNYWSYGRGMHAMPSHNIYVPVTHNIMPRPKFRDYNKEDQIGEDFTYRNREEHTHSRVKADPSSIKPSPFSPPLQSGDFERSRIAHMTYDIPKNKFIKDRRLSKSKRTNHTSISMPMKWRFSTTVGLSEEQEKAEMEKFKLTQGLSMTVDKNPYSLWNKFAQIIFK